MTEVISKIKEVEMSDNKLFIICATIVLMTGICSFAYYGMQKDRLMSANIENGIVKGVDPIAIKCVYDSHNTMCAVYSATRHSGPIVDSSSKK